MALGIITHDIWQAPSGWSWVIYRDGHLVAQGSRCSSKEQAREFMEANKRMQEAAA